MSVDHVSSTNVYSSTNSYIVSALVFAFHLYRYLFLYFIYNNGYCWVSNYSLMNIDGLFLNVAVYILTFADFFWSSQST